MMARVAILFAALLVASINASPLFAPKYHPIVVWHGLGDSAYSEGMQSLASELKEAFPGVYVHLISLADNLSGDQKAGFFGNVNEQIEQVCSDLKEIEELKNGFDAIGFSQGGQFLRGYVERCNTPAVRNLVTFGSQHQGISDLPACKPGDLFCRLAEGALRGGIYSDYAQSNLVTAQYYRDPTQLANYEKYLEVNHFIADINNEVEQKEKYKKRLESLDSLVLLMFDKDVTVEPKQSSWFATYPIAKGDKKGSKNETEVVPLRQSDIYTEDWIGLKTLDKRGALVLELCHGIHMQIDPACQMKVFGKYIGVSPPSSLLPSSIRHAWARTVYTLTSLRTASLPTSLQLIIFLSAVLLLRIAVTLISTAVVARRSRQGAIRLL